MVICQIGIFGIFQIGKLTNFYIFTIWKIEKSITFFQNFENQNSAPEITEFWRVRPFYV